MNFVPLRGDFARGIFASVYTRAVEGMSQEDYRKIFEDYYAESPFAPYPDWLRFGTIRDFPRVWFPRIMTQVFSGLALAGTLLGWGFLEL